MLNAAKNNSLSPVSLAVVRVLLLLVVALCLGQTRVWGFAVTPQPASGVFESVTPSSTGENYDGCPYDASDSLLAAKSVKPGQTMSSYPQGRVVGGKGESPRLSDPPAGMKESSAWDPTPDNLALMERGRPPVGRDSLPVELHHRNQSPAGPLDQMTSTTHDNIPHPISPSQINRSQFGGERGRYWRGEARTLNGQ